MTNASHRFSLRRLAWATAVIGATLSPNAASAHDLWLTLSGDAAQRRVVINYGHPDDRPPPVADKVIDLVMIRPDGKTSLRDGLSMVQRKGVYVIKTRPIDDNGSALLAARYDNGFWAKTTDGTFRNATRRLIPDANESVWSGKFAKAVTGPNAPWPTVLGHDLELVPLSDPSAVKPGQSLRLRLLFRGKPLPGAEIERGDGATPVPEKDIPRFTTDAEGVAAVPIMKTGPHLLVVDHRVAPSASSDQADADLFNATFWFDLGNGK